jgi:hypothetical protein
MKTWLTLFTTDPIQFDMLGVQQIVAICGSGVLSNDASSAVEFREYLQVAKSDNLARYVDTCLKEPFERSGYVLQDVINEIGRRLGYRVENGLYQGRHNAIGFDGLWSTPDGHSLVIEVKTTDTYRINLDVIASYRERLVASERINKNSSVLLVVGRQDTGDFEAQIRGSKHAWSFRLISADALLKLMFLKEKTEEASTSKIHDLLTPFEYTRLDRLIDIAFTVVEDASSPLEEAPAPNGAESSVEATGEDSLKQDHTPSWIQDELKSKILLKLSRLYEPFVKETRALYSTADRKVRAVVTVSKVYAAGNYWYAYHPSWDEFLGAAETGLFVLGCIGRPDAYAIPRAWMQARLSNLNTTSRSDGKVYYHIHIRPELDGTMTLRLTNGHSDSLDSFKLSLE